MSHDSPSSSGNRIQMLDGRHATADEITAAAMQVEDALEDRARRKAIDAWQNNGVWMRRLAAAALTLVMALGGVVYRVWTTSQEQLADLKTKHALLEQRVQFLERAVAPMPYGVPR